MKIAIKDLRSLYKNILKQTEKTLGKEIEINTSHYWIFCEKDIFNFNIKKPRLKENSLIDDLKNLRKILDNKHKPTVADLERLGNIIKIIGDTIYLSKIPFL